jgi:hypothetical protein
MRRDDLDLGRDVRHAGTKRSRSPEEEAGQDCGQSIDATSARTKAGQDRQREQAAESGAPNEDDHKNTVCG